MVKEAITHRHNRQFCYCVGDGHFIVKIITKKDDLSGINYMYMDKYPNPGHNELVSLPMVKVASDSLFDYYEIKYKNTYIATRYCFELHDKDTDEVLYYSNYKFLPAPPTLGDDYFNMPKRMLEVDSLNLLTWMNEGIVYQI